MTVPLCRPTIGPEELAAVGDVLASGQLVQGAQVAAFEAAISARVAGQPVAATSSGTAALHLALLVLGVGPGDEVIVPGVTFPAPANVVEAVGARAVAVDVDPLRWALDPALVAAAVGPHTRAVIVVHPFGVPADVPALRAAVGPHVAIIEDAACALGSTLDGRPCGALGDVACFSFHPRKVVTTGEGGALTSPRADLVERARLLRNHGMGAAPAGATDLPAARFREVGLNLRLSDVHAAIGVVQMQRLDALIDERAALAERARSALTGTGLELLPGLFAPGAVVQSLVGLLPRGVERRTLLAALAARGVEATVATYAIHRLEPWRARPWARDEALPLSARIHDAGVTLPLWPGMGPEKIDEVAAILHDLLRTTAAPSTPSRGDEA